MNLISTWPLALVALAFAALPEGPGPAPPPPPPGPADSPVSPPTDGRAPSVPGPRSIAGRVVMRTGGDLPGGLEIDYPEDLPGGQRRRRETSVGKDGTFSIGGCTPGRSHDLIVKAFSYVTIGRAEGVAAGTHDLVIHVSSAGTIQGRVLDSSGTPVGKGIPVRAGLSREPETGFCGTVCSGETSSTETREDGTFLLEWLGNWNFTVTAIRESTTGKEAASASWIPPGSTGVDLRLTPGPWDSEREGDRRESSPHEPAMSAITGRLLLPDGTGTENRFFVYAVPEGDGEPWCARVSPTGAFETGSLEAGTYALRIHAHSMVATEVKGVKPGARGLRIPVPSHGTISGQVFDSSGRPVGKGSRVSAEAVIAEGGSHSGARSDAVTREDGTFVIQFLADHEFSVRAGPPRGKHVPSSTDIPGWAVKGVRTGAKGVALHLQAPVTLRGTVLAADGNPCNDASVEAIGVGPTGERVKWSPVGTDPKGAFVFRGIAAGKVLITVIKGTDRHRLGEFEAPAEDLVLQIPGD